VVEFGLVGKTMHQVDEHVEVADITRLANVYRGILDAYFDRFAA
jgi:succinyl-diaminopimelate desuccinylase